MKNFVLFACLLVVLSTGCSKQPKGCATVQPQDEVPQILAFAAANNLTLIKDTSGIYYQIINPGTGASPTINDSISVNYVGELLNGTIFNQYTTDPVSFKLRGVIEGWQTGIPLIKKGGRIKMVIPSAYAYGCNEKTDQSGRVVIPANSILYFDVSNLIIY